MESSPRGFLPRLDEALRLRAAWLENVVLPALKESVVTYRSLFEGISGTLVKKGLLREDHYDYERRADGVMAPPDSALPDDGDNAEVSRRVVAYRRQLDFLVDEKPFTLASMDQSVSKGFSSLLSYVDWEHFGEGSQSATTRALARFATRVRSGNDQLSASMLHESLARIRESARDIRSRLAEVETWHNESWKAAVRAKALPQVLPRITGAEEERVAETVLIGEAVARALPGSAWHPELVHEILAEDPEKLLLSLAVPIASPAAAGNGADQRLALLDAVRGICRIARDIGSCQEALARNERGVEKPRRGILQRLRQWLFRSPGGRGDRRYEIEYHVSPRADATTETVDFPGFLAEVQELRTVLAETGRAGGRGYRRIQAMDTEEVLDFLGWLLQQLRPLYHRMDGLNTLFHARTAGGSEGGMRGIKLELLAIENGMKRAEAAHRECAERAERTGQERP